MEDIEWDSERHLIGADSNYLVAAKDKGDRAAIELAISARVEANKIIDRMMDGDSCHGNTIKRRDKRLRC